MRESTVLMLHYGVSAKGRVTWSTTSAFYTADSGGVRTADWFAVRETAVRV